MAAPLEWLALMLGFRQNENQPDPAKENATLERRPRMSEPDKTGNRPPKLGETLFLSGLCLVCGIFPLLIGLGVISGNVKAGPAGRVLAVVAGFVFIFAGIMVFIRDRAGARNGEEIPATAPLFLRAAANIVSTTLVALFACVSSVIAFGPFFSPDMLPDMIRQMGAFGAAIFRILSGIFALIFWYAVFYLIRDKIRKHGAA
ncbi:MAG: hypothetical protein KIT15_13275 [Xanthobacteraceae bacterium]|nr:hypothetical protein [Xanthobacteraceae bacterium]MBX3550794.1 hypothetical protein [Xanthobacteraceae bacterium]MCW5675542.1 hypothetical protein [Xanthobacteraceae bacterium]